jgi:predicted acetyltransferase
MSICIERLKGRDYEEFMDFIDLVFSQHSNPHHFYVDLPLLFAPTDEYMQNQYVLRENGRIRSAVGAIPYTYYVGDEQFLTKTITNVATHHLHRGKGYMQMLLAHIIEDMKVEGVDFATLHGNRERYRFWGFESAGVTNNALFTRENANNRIKMGQKTSYHFKLLEDKDIASIRQCVQLFNRQPQRYLRPEETFMQTMHMWHANAYLVLDEEDRFCGYFNLSARKTHMQELLLTDSTTTAEVISSFLMHFNLPSIILSISPFDTEMLRIAYNTAEGLNTNLMCRVSIYKLERLLAACLNIKKKYAGYMPQGEFVLESMFGRHLIRNDGEFTVTKTDCPYDLSVDGFEVYSLLFGPSEYVMPYDKAALGPLGAWFPAPLYINAVDRY